MIARRDMLMGGACVLSLGTAEWLRPRSELRLLRPGRELTQLLPTRFGAWSMGEGGDIVIPKTPDSLQSTLYSDTVARSYRREGPEMTDVMLLVAYGGAQSDLLQLHRPESCYPAVGFDIVARQLLALPIGDGQTVPAVALTAQAGSRIEDVVYWTRLGEGLPQTAGEQRRARFDAAVAGYIGDGLLVRASAMRVDESAPPLFGVLRDFLTGLVGATAAADRAALIGTTRATAIARS